jgi:hypothetical protein
MFAVQESHGSVHLRFSWTALSFPDGRSVEVSSELRFMERAGPLFACSILLAVLFSSIGWMRARTLSVMPINPKSQRRTRISGKNNSRIGKNSWRMAPELLRMRLRIDEITLFARYANRGVAADGKQRCQKKGSRHDKCSIAARYCRHRRTDRRSGTSR